MMGIQVVPYCIVTLCSDMVG